MARTRGMKARTRGTGRYPSRRNPVRVDTPPDVIYLGDDNFDPIVVTEEEAQYAIVPYVEANHYIVPYVEQGVDVVVVEEVDTEPNDTVVEEEEHVVVEEMVVEEEEEEAVVVEEMVVEEEEAAVVEDIVPGTEAAENEEHVEHVQEEPEREDPGQCMQPLQFHFKHQKWLSISKVATRCDLKKTVDFIEKKLTKRELAWFQRHEQFKHLFHMPRHENRMSMGMWMLLLRTPKTTKTKECWFVVNGVPIRYSLREHALLSGLDCTEYPPNYEDFGSFSLVRRCFRREKKIDIFHIREKLGSMESRGDDRLKVAVLYLLSTIIKGRSKVEHGYIEPFLLKVVDDLAVCETFPWGRFSFLNTMEVMAKWFERLKGKVHGSCTFAGFILPLEILAFEAIPQLGREFRKDVTGASSSCPRLCKRRFKKISTKGIPLGELYEALGTTKEISSILNPEPSEIPLLQRLFEGNVDDKDDAIVDSWTRTLEGNPNGIWWEDLFNKDVSTRAELIEDGEPTDEDEAAPAAEEGESLQEKLEAFKSSILDELKNFKEEIKKNFEEQLNGMRQTLIDHIINQHSTRDEGEASRNKDMEAEGDDTPTVQLSKRRRMG